MSPLAALTKRPQSPSPFLHFEVHRDNCASKAGHNADATEHSAAKRSNSLEGILENATHVLGDFAKLGHSFLVLFNRVLVLWTAVVRHLLRNFLISPADALSRRA